MFFVSKGNLFDVYCIKCCSPAQFIWVLVWLWSDWSFLFDYHQTDVRRWAHMQSGRKCCSPAHLSESVSPCRSVCIVLNRKGGKWLTLSTLGKIFSRRYIEIFFLIFSQKTGFEISIGDNLHEISNPVFREKKKKKKNHQFVVCWISPETGKGQSNGHRRSSFVVTLMTNLSVMFITSLSIVSFYNKNEQKTS